MSKRFAAGLLWFFAAWYASSLVTNTIGVADTVGSIIGLAAGLLIAVDPLHRIWASTQDNPTVEVSVVAEPA